jgi:hypothetical protein
MEVPKPQVSNSTLRTDLLPGLSPSIHSIDQIKVVDRFRGGHIVPILRISLNNR